MDNLLLDNELQEAERFVSRNWAGFWIRVVASIIDGLVLIPLTALSLFNIYRFKILPLYLVTLILSAIYKPFMEYKYGATLGKMALKLKVVNEEFKPLTLSQAITRYIPWISSHLVSFISILLLFQNSEFSGTTGFMEVSALQREIISPVFGFLTSLFLLISCLAVAFSDRKQGLHDLMAKTYCIELDA